jgi:hypothetical protein
LTIAIVTIPRKAEVNCTGGAFQVEGGGGVFQVGNRMGHNDESLIAVEVRDNYMGVVGRSRGGSKIGRRSWSLTLIVIGTSEIRSRNRLPG